MLSGTAACVSLTIVAVDVHTIVTRSTPTAGKVDALLNGGLDIEHQARSVLLDGRVAIDNANRFAIDERFVAEKQTPVLVNELHAAVGTLTTTIASVQPITAAAAGTLNATTERVRALQAPEDAATATLASLNGRIADPHLTHAFLQLDDATVKANLALDQVDLAAIKGYEAAAHADAVAANAELESNRIAHPFAWVGRLFHRKPKK